MIRRLAALLACLLALAAPARAESAALARDYDALCAVLSEEYPFFPVLARRGIDAGALLDETRPLAIGGDVRQFYDAVSLMFWRMGNFAHLSWVDPAAYLNYLELAEAGALSDGQRALVMDERTRRMYASLDTQAGKAVRRPEVDVDYDEGRNALVLRFASFDGALLERDRRAVADALARHPDAAHIVFDITGNRGGSDAYWSAVLVAPFGGTFTQEIVSWLKPTPLALGQVGEDRAREAREMPGFAAALGMTRCVIDEAVIPFEPYDGEIVGTNARRWVLIDGGTFSAADSFASFCKATGWATLVGSATMGDGADAYPPLLVRLPETGLLLRFSATAAANADGTLNAETGTRPDVPCKPRETPLAAWKRAVG